MLVGFILFLTCLILLLNIIYFFGLLKSFRRKNKPEKNNDLGISVLIAARNEESNIKQVIQEIKTQSYRNFKLFIVDDYSSDNTYNILEEIEKEENRICILKNNLRPGKKNALSVGIRRIEDEYILITDADCFPEKDWISSFSKKFAEGYDLLFGLAPFIKEKTITNRIACFENLRGFMLSVSALGLKVPYSAAARSMAFRKSSFERIGGYSNTMEIPFGDDGLLIREAVKNKLKIGFVHGEGSFVYTKSKSNWKDYFRQRKRHTTTSFYYSNHVKLLLAVCHLVNLLPLFLFFFIPFNFYFSLPLLTKLFFDSVSVLVLQKRFGYKFSLHQVIFYQLLYEFVLIVNFLNALKGNVKWK